MLTRKQFIKQASLATVGAMALPHLSRSFAPSDKLRIGVIGTGLRGQDHIELCLRRNDVDLVAICDIQQVMLDDTMKIFAIANKTKPRIFTGDKYAYRKMLEAKDIDAVIIATPWEWHYEMSIDAMNAGKHVGCEVIAATTLEEIRNLIEIQAQTGMQYSVLENVCYRRDVMAIMNMLRQGMFGELIHLQGGYQHDLREVKFNNGTQPYGGGAEFNEKGFSEAQWRTQHSLKRNGDLYPTHGIGPLAMMCDINRGNRFTSLVSYASKARGLHEHIVNTGGESHPNAGLKWMLGDVVTTMIKTEREETILLQHDTSLPRPYSLGFRVQGTRGLWMDVNKSIYLEGKTKEKHRWEDAKPYLDEYDHPLWKKFAADAQGAGHGGMDFFVLHEFIEALRNKTAVPIDIYDAATWTAITPLSEESISKGGISVAFPDFTKGKYKVRQNIFAR
ncbi:MAG: Gfo/Idh/MocA family oxidoreductase [Bacteroidetes bacterium]|nr:Gfo/Idh/MocA family oxidoreductase [Bacteroidota bacterium]